MLKKGKFRFSGNMIVTSILVLVILGSVGIFFLGLNKGWWGNTQFSLLNQDLIKILDDLVSGSDCSLSIYPRIITSGDLISGTITDGKNTRCEAYGNKLGEGTWNKFWEGTTGSSGSVTYSDHLYVTGTFYIRVICDTNGNGIMDNNDCITNREEITVYPANQDSDGDGFTDQQENDAGTNPNNPNDYPREDNCDALCGGSYEGGRSVDSFSECTEGESPIAVGDEICCCTNPDFDCSNYCQNLDTPYSELYDGFYTETLSLCEDRGWELCPINQIHIYDRGGNSCCCLVCLDENHLPYAY